jgi:hypothetical protein
MKQSLATRNLMRYCNECGSRVHELASNFSEAAMGDAAELSELESRVSR